MFQWLLATRLLYWWVLTTRSIISLMSYKPLILFSKLADFKNLRPIDNSVNSIIFAFSEDTIPRLNTELRSYITFSTWSLLQTLTSYSVILASRLTTISPMLLLNWRAHSGVSTLLRHLNDLITWLTIDNGALVSFSLFRPSDRSFRVASNPPSYAKYCTQLRTNPNCMSLRSLINPRATRSVYLLSSSKRRLTRSNYVRSCTTTPKVFCKIWTGDASLIITWGEV